MTESVASHPCNVPLVSNYAGASNQKLVVAANTRVGHHQLVSSAKKKVFPMFSPLTLPIASIPDIQHGYDFCIHIFVHQITEYIRRYNNGNIIPKKDYHSFVR